MKILFVNPPVIRSENSSPENDFKIEGFVFKPEYRKIPGMGRIFTILHKYTGLGKGIRYGVRAGSRWPWTMNQPHGGPPYPFIMGYSAAFLKFNGIDVNIIDSVAEEEYSYDNFIKEVKNESPDIVVIETSTPTFDIDIWIAEIISDFADVAMAGPHVSSSYDKINSKYPFVKYLLKGEYIISSLKMARTKESSVYESAIVTDLDSIPFPFRDYRSATKYYDPTMPTARPQLQIWGGKGCPFKCIYCLWPQTMYKGNVFLRKPEKIIQEIRESVEKYNYKSIFFDDDTFNLGTERVSKLCDGLARIGLPWTMMGRLDCSPDWLYNKMVDCGCVGMRFGIETFDLRILKNIKKGLERTDFLKTLNYITIKHPQLMIHLTMMKDLPGQTDEIYQRDIKILQDLGYSKHNIMRSYQLAACVPFPGTEMYNRLAEEKGGEILSNYKLYDGGRDTIMSKLKV